MLFKNKLKMRVLRTYCQSASIVAVFAVDNAIAIHLGKDLAKIWVYTTIVVIGAGFGGLAAALEATERGLKVGLRLERRELR